ncbi:MAG: signal peptidase I [Candidatus Nanohaloarchaea archaeon]
MRDEIQRVRKFVDENRFLDETYFIILSVVLAFGILQTMGTGLGTEKPVVTVISTSMCPALQVGDILLVKHTDYSKIEEGDVIVYNVPDTAKLVVNGQSYFLRVNGTRQTDTADTPAGQIRLRDVKVPTRGEDTAALEIDDQVFKVEEGETYNINGAKVKVEYLTDLPYQNVPIVHRVVRKTPSYLETIGDNNPTQLEFEKRVRPSQIYGTVYFEIIRIGLVKILAMDFLGYGGDRPFIFDSTPTCGSA